MSSDGVLLQLYINTYIELVGCAQQTWCLWSPTFALPMNCSFTACLDCAQNGLNATRCCLLHRGLR